MTQKLSRLHSINPMQTVVFEFQHDFINAFNEIKQKNKIPILCGGTGMYIESVIKGYKLLSVPENKDLRESLKHKTLEELALILATYKKLHNSTDIDTWFISFHNS